MNTLSFAGSFAIMGLAFVQREKEMNEEFEQRAEEARKLYWDACKYPRKKKKAIRKKAKADFYFYKQLAQPVLFSF